VARASIWSPTPSKRLRTRRWHAADPPSGAGAGKALWLFRDDYSSVWDCATSGHCSNAGKPSLADLFDEDMLGDDLEAWLPTRIC